VFISQKIFLGAKPPDNHIRDGDGRKDEGRGKKRKGREGEEREEEGKKKGGCGIERIKGRGGCVVTLGRMDAPARTDGRIRTDGLGP
jgi:hypothetical protein